LHDGSMVWPGLISNVKTPGEPFGPPGVEPANPFAFIRDPTRLLGADPSVAQTNNHEIVDFLV